MRLPPYPEHANKLLFPLQSTLSILRYTHSRSFSLSWQYQLPNRRQRQWNPSTRCSWASTPPKLMLQRSLPTCSPSTPLSLQQPSTSKVKKPACWKTMMNLSHSGIKTLLPHCIRLKLTSLLQPAPELLLYFRLRYPRLPSYIPHPYLATHPLHPTNSTRIRHLVRSTALAP